jgi:hypothetical protein
MPGSAEGRSDLLRLGVGPAEHVQGAGPVSKCPSKAASLAGCVWATLLGLVVPVTSASTLNTQATSTPMAKLRLAKLVCRFLRM